MLAKRLIILAYHRVLDAPDPMRKHETDLTMFTSHMRMLAKYFNVLPLLEAINRLQEGSLPHRAVCITFDDGYADSYEFALPMLKCWRFPATFFIATGFLNGGRMWNDAVIEAVRRAPGPTLDLNEINLGAYQIDEPEQRYNAATSLLDKLKYLPLDKRQSDVDVLTEIVGAKLPNDLMMNSEQVRDLPESGMDVGGHTVNHPILSQMEDSRARAEIAASKEQLEEITGRPVFLFAYPNGKPGKDYNARHVSMVRELGFSAAVSTASGVASRSTDVYQLPRSGPWDRTPARFVFRLLHNSLRR